MIARPLPSPRRRPDLRVHRGPYSVSIQLRIVLKAKVMDPFRRNHDLARGFFEAEIVTDLSALKEIEDSTLQAVHF